MKSKKMLSGITSMVCALSLMPAMPEIFQTYTAQAVYNDFESNYDGWYCNSNTAQIIAENGKGFNNSRGMIVSGRKNKSDGASSSKGFYLTGGKEYNYSLKVYSDTDEVFRVSLLCIDEKTGEETSEEIISEKVKAGSWTRISDKYTAPKGSYEFRLTITTDSTNDFCFDDVSITEKVSGKQVSATGEKGLKDEFAGYFRVGNILNGMTVNNSAITATLLKDCNAIECENETKPDATLVKEGSANNDIKVSLNSCSAIADFCIRNNIAFRGHTMVWHSQTPEWFFKDNFEDYGNWVDKNTMNQRMESYIKNMFSAFATQYPDLNIYAYDVCNECVSDDTNRTANNSGARIGGFGNGASPWVQVYGDNSFVRQAFVYARKYAPENCDLYYNDYNEYWDHKRDCIYNMCKSLYNDGLLDGVAMQSHVPANATGFAGTDSYIEAMHKYLSIGCDLQISELDISVESGKYSYEEQAEKYKAIFKAAMDWNKNPQSDGRVTLVQVWGPNDANSWLKEGSNGLMYDKNNNPKPAYTAVTSIVPVSEWGDGSTYSGETTPSKIEPNQYGWYFNHGFEGDIHDWQSRGSATLLTSGRTAYVGSESLLVSERKSAWNGASFALNPRAFLTGEEYSFSANVTYFDGDDTDTFMMKLEYTDSEGKTQYDEIASGTAVKGKWLQLANKNYRIPSGASDMKIYIETAETTNNFYIDEAIGAVGGTSILGAGQPEIKKVQLGDLDFDGNVSAFDMVLARKGLTDGFSDDDTKKSADVDQSGKYEVNDLLLIEKYLLGKIKEFPVAEKTVDTVAMESVFKTVNIAESLKKDGENNALYTQRFGADPGFLVYNDRLYVYTTNDAFEYDSNGQIKENSYAVQTINCCSSADLVNWTDHGAINAAGANGSAKWAYASWAPDACVKKINGKDKFFLYFANSAGGIGVLTADSPEGPWTDPIGKPLITKQTANCGDVEWLFDPAVFVDDDGTGYLYFGGGIPEGKESDPGTARAVKLGDDMISLAGEPVRINPPYLFEDSSILKIGSKYYYSYCTNFKVPAGQAFNGGEICYMTADNPLGPFTFKGRMFKNPASYGLDKGGNNHHSLVQFKGNYYLLYHARAVENRMGYSLNYRSPHIDYADVSNGNINVTGTMTGVKQVGNPDPYVKVQAETMSNQSRNVRVSGLGNTTVSGKKGDWIKISGADFAKGTDSFTVKASSANGAVIKVCTELSGGKVLAYAEVPSGSTMSEITVPAVDSASGINDIYLIFSDELNIDWWQFS